MTMKSVYNPETGVCDRVMRSDAVKYKDRYEVPTTSATLWVSNMDEFRDAGGVMAFNGDQTEIEMLLPEPFKFAIGFR